MTRARISPEETTTRSGEFLHSVGTPNASRRDNGQSIPDVVQPKYPWYLGLKACIDLVIALIMFVMAIPAIVVAGILIKLTSKGPVFYLQARLGKNGCEIKIFKLRTMIHNAETTTGAVWEKPDDPRITRVGKFLRMTYVDEFPQFLNVIFGQMSLIGPRPERPEIAEQLEWKLPLYRNRLRVRPGITGIAQLNLPSDSDIEGVRIKLIHDLYYVQHVNPWLDARILAFTA
jgi:lipopolysaccharide/colanic/teichoic acid biosynthesis glycosyltransferase